jgi:hypothetical protein
MNELAEAACDQVIGNIVQTRAGGAVQRCHGIRHNGSYSNAEHTWGVMVLLWHIYPDQFAALAPYALSHDVPEFIFGDVPAPSMRYVPGLRASLGKLEDRLNRLYGNKAEGALDEASHQILKSCDRLDLWFWCKEQLMLGNIFASECKTELERYFAEPNALEARARQVYDRAKGSALLPRQAGVAEAIVALVEKEEGK